MLIKEWKRILKQKQVAQQVERGKAGKSDKAEDMDSP